MSPKRSRTRSGGRHHSENHHRSESRHHSPSKHRSGVRYRDSSDRKHNSHSHNHRPTSHSQSRHRSKGRSHSPYTRPDSLEQLVRCACRVPCPCRYDSCKTGPDVYTRVLGPTADETFLLGLQTLFSYYTSTDQLEHSKNTEHPEILVNSEHTDSLDHHDEAEEVLAITNLPVSSKDYHIQAVPDSRSSESQTSYLTKHSQLQATSLTNHRHSQTDTAAIEEEGSQTGQLSRDHESSQTSEVSFSNSESQTHQEEDFRSYRSGDKESLQSESKSYRSGDKETLKTESRSYRSGDKETLKTESRSYRSGDKETLKTESRSYRSGDQDNMKGETTSEPCFGNDGKRCPCANCCAKRLNAPKRTVRVSSKCLCSPSNTRKNSSLYKRHGKSVCSCTYSSTEYGGYTTDSTESNNIDHILIKQQHGEVGQVKYAITRITKFASYTTFEIMRSTKKKPKMIPTSIEGVFVLRNNQVNQ